MPYKFDSPHDWFNQHIEAIAASPDAVSIGDQVTRLAFECKQLARLLDADQLQDEYQNLMSEDGYFEDASKGGR